MNSGLVTVLKSDALSAGWNGKRAVIRKRMRMLRKAGENMVEMNANPNFLRRFFGCKPISLKEAIREEYVTRYGSESLPIEAPWTYAAGGFLQDAKKLIFACQVCTEDTLQVSIEYAAMIREWKS